MQTITAADAALASWQVVVVGAGPAGAAVAWRLADRGVRVLLVDRHPLPRGKVCGSCLSTRACRELDALGPAALPGAALRLDAVRLAHRGRSVLIPLPGGRVVSREMLDAHLVRQAIAAGCHWVPGVHVTAIREDGAAAPLDMIATVGPTAAPVSHAFRAEFVIVATGLADHVRIGAGSRPGDVARTVAPGSRIGAGAVLDADACGLPAGELVMAVGREGYCGIVRLEDGRIDVAAALDRAAISREADPGAAVARLLDEAAAGAACHLPDAAAIRAAAFAATPPLTRRAPLVAGAARRILRVGDAAGYVEPFTGEGIGWSLAAARILATALVEARGLRPPREAADRYVAAHRRHFAPLHARCRVVAGGLRRPGIVATAVAAAAVAPWAARRIVPAVIGASGAGGRR